MSMNSSQSSGLLTTSTLLWTGKTYLKGVKVFTDGTNNATVTIYSNTAASGPVIYKSIVIGANQTAPLDDFSHMVQVDDGLYVQIAGTGASCIVYYN